MSRYDGSDCGRRVAAALIVQQYGPEDVDALDFLAHHSRADPFELETDEVR